MRPYKRRGRVRETCAILTEEEEEERHFVASSYIKRVHMYGAIG